MNDDTLHDRRATTAELREMVLNAALLGDTLKELGARKLLDQALANHDISDTDARVMMAVSEQLIQRIRNGMGLNQALTWLCNAGWPSKINHVVLERMGV